MEWKEVPAYQRLVQGYPDLQEQRHRRAFEAFLERMWSQPTTYKKILQAYMEFLTPSTPKFRRLNSPKPKWLQRKSERKSSSRRSRRRRSKKRRSRRRSKKSKGS